MSADRDRSDPLAPLIEAILDGRPPDAARADAEASLDSQQRTLLEPLRILAAIALLPDAPRAPETGGDERFVLEGEIGRGAFGVVHRAWDKTLRRHVALKIIPLRLPLAASVLSEARRLARVRHPNVVTIHDVFERGHEGRICMELLSGQTLAQIVARRRHLPVEDVVQIGVAVCGALDAIHGLGLVHGDIKAHNIIHEDSGRVVVMDFGAGSGLTGVDLAPIHMTPRYMAPEISSGSAPLPQSDVFSLGVLLHYLVTGTYPTTAESAREAPMARRLAEALPDLPRPLDTVVARALDRDPGRRYQTAGELARALRGSARPRLGLAALLATVVMGLCSVAWSARAARPDAPVAIVEREILTPSTGVNIGGMTDDGQIIALEDALSGLSLLNTRTGEVTALVPQDEQNPFAEGIQIDSRRRRVIFGRISQECACVEVREVPLRGGESRALLKTADAEAGLVSLSADGNRLLLRHSVSRAEYELIAADLNSGIFSPPISIGRTTWVADLSPDGQFVAFDGSPDGTPTSDLFIADIATGTVKTLLPGRFDDLTPHWMPDGGGVVFASDRAGGLGLWSLSVSNGQPVGVPMLLHRDMGRFSPLELTASGVLALWRSPALDVEVAAFDPTQGVVSGTPAALAVRTVGINTAPSWSPDGRSLIFAAERRPFGAGRRTLVVHSLADGAEREIIVSVDGPLEPRWSPDGDYALIRGPGLRDGVQGGRLVDLSAGQVVKLFPYQTGTNPQWGAKGDEYFYGFEDAIYRVDVRTGARSQVAFGGWRPRTFVVSPDGTEIAAFAVRNGVRAVIRVPSSGGTPTIVYSLPQADRAPLLWHWSPDGKRLLATMPSDAMNRLVTIELNGGRVSSAGLERPGLSWVELSPRGDQLAYGVGINRRTLWQIQNFLSRSNQKH